MVDTFCDIPVIILPFLLFSFLPIFLFYANLLLIGFIYFAFLLDMHNFYTSILCRKEMYYVRHCCNYYFPR